MTASELVLGLQYLVEPLDLGRVVWAHLTPESQAYTTVGFSLLNVTTLRGDFPAFKGESLDLHLLD